MLGKLTGIFTTASRTGVALRYVSTIIGSILAILGILGALSPEQVDDLTRQMPVLISAIGGLVAAVAPIYAIVTKSSSDKAAEAAKQIDAQVPASASVEIVTPGPQPNIVVPAS